MYREESMYITYIVKISLENSYSFLTVEVDHLQKSYTPFVA